MRMVAAIAIFALLGTPVLGEGRMTVQPGFGATPPPQADAFDPAPPKPRPRPNREEDDAGPGWESVEPHLRPWWYGLGPDDDYKKAYEDESTMTQEELRRWREHQRELQRDPKGAYERELEESYRLLEEHKQWQRLHRAGQGSREVDI